MYRTGFFYNYTKQLLIKKGAHDHAAPDVSFGFYCLMVRQRSVALADQQENDQNRNTQK